MLLHSLNSRPARAMTFWGFIFLSFLYFLHTLPPTPALRHHSPEKVPSDEIEHGLDSGHPVSTDLPESAFLGTDGPTGPVDPFNAGTPENVDDDDEDDVVVPPLHKIENFPSYSNPDVSSDDESDSNVGAAITETNGDEEDEETPDALEGTREAFEQLIDDMDRDHAILESEVENLVQAEDDKSVNGGEAMAIANEALSKVEANQAKAHWHNFNHMYKNIKDVAKDMHGHLSQAGSKGKAAASKHTAEFLAAVKAAEGDEDIQKINLVHTTKRSIDVDVDADADNTPSLRRWLDHLSEAKHRWIYRLTDTKRWWLNNDLTEAKTDDPSKHRLSDEEVEELRKEWYEAQKMYIEPEYYKKWLKENNPEEYKERFGGDDNGSGNLAKRWIFYDEPKELSADDIKLRQWLKKEKPAYYKIHFAKEIALQEKKAKAEAKAKAKEEEEKANAAAEAEGENEDERKRLEEARRLEWIEQTKVVTTRISSASKDDFNEWLKEHHPKIFRNSYPDGKMSDEYKMAHKYGNQDHTIPERVRKAMYETKEYGISSALFHDWLKEYFPEWRRNTYSYRKDVVEERQKLGLDSA